MTYHHETTTTYAASQFSRLVADAKGEYERRKNERTADDWDDDAEIVLAAYFAVPDDSREVFRVYADCWRDIMGHTSPYAEGGEWLGENDGAGDDGDNTLRRLKNRLQGSIANHLAKTLDKEEGK